MAKVLNENQRAAIDKLSETGANGVLTSAAAGIGLDFTEGKKLNVKIGDGLEINEDGELSIDSTSLITPEDVATDAVAGIVKIGDGIDVEDDGTISVTAAGSLKKIQYYTADANTSDGKIHIYADSSLVEFVDKLIYIKTNSDTALNNREANVWIVVHYSGTTLNFLLNRINYFSSGLPYSLNLANRILLVSFKHTDIPDAYVASLENYSLGVSTVGNGLETDGDSLKVKPGTGIQVDSNGVSAKIANAKAAGIVRPGAGLSIDGEILSVTGGLPTAGTSGQIILKSSNTNYDTKWVTPIRRFNNLTVATTAWRASTTYADYPYYAIAFYGDELTANGGNVIFSPEDANSGNFAPVAEFYSKQVYIYAKTIPTNTITIPVVEVFSI